MEYYQNKPEASFDVAMVPAAKPRILVMDGSEHIRSMIASLLGIHGYEVESAAEGGETLALFRRAAEAGRPFGAVILDRSVVQGMDALQTIEQLRALDPSVKAILSSAFLFGPTDLYKRYGFAGVLPKPFTSLELRQLIAGVLEIPPA